MHPRKQSVGTPRPYLTAHKKGLPLLTGLVLAALAAAPAQAQNLVTNPGFETGSFSGWTTTPAASGSFFGVSGGTFAHSGSYGAFFGAGGTGDDGISQSVPTVAGDSYAVSFYLKSNSGPPNDFKATFGGSPLLDLENAASSPFTQYTFRATAAGGSTALTFAGRQPGSEFLLDDVSVTDLGPAPAVPEASTTASFGLLLALGLGGLAVAARRRKGAASL